MSTENSIVEFSIIPIGTGDSLSDPVARCTQHIRQSGLPNELHAMGTIVEGDLDQCLGLVRTCLEEVLKDAPRASASVKIDVHPGKTGGLRARTEAVENKL